jgi:hypothetical protein
VRTTESGLLNRFVLPDGFGTLLVDDAEPFPDGELLFGCVLGKRTICVGMEGLRDASSEDLAELRASIDGRFAAVFDDGDAWVARTDFACQEQLFLYQSGDGWTIGSSLFEVAMRAATRGMQLTRESLHARSVQRGMLRRMPTGLITPFAEITRLPIGADVLIDKRSRRAEPRLRTVEESPCRYAELSVHQIADEFLRSLVGALASMQHSSGLVCQASVQNEPVVMSGGLSKDSLVPVTCQKIVDSRLHRRPVVFAGNRSDLVLRVERKGLEDLELGPFRVN